MDTLRQDDFQVYRKELIVTHKQTIEAHLNKDVDFLLKDVSMNFMSVNEGKISYPSMEEMRESFTQYLDNTEFSVYRDLCELIIGFSDDGSVAWSTVQVRVEGKTKRDNKMHDIGFTCSWITLYRRKDDKWIRFTEVSSFE